jgi:predicted esterase/catechol 2,3-dioxygenase-like lactoylglutathione lyase family enzyme
MMYIIAMSDELPALSMPYRIRRPKARLRKPPLLVLLHGIGATEADFLKMVNGYDDRFLILSFTSPFHQSAGGSAWFNMERVGGTAFVNAVQAEFSRKELLKTVAEAVQAFKVDPGQVYWMGFSEGAVIALSVLLTAPEQVAGVVAITGQILPETRSMMAPVEKLKGKPVLLLHGLQDPVYPISVGRAASVLLASLPIALEYHIIAGMEHILTQECLDRARQWLSKRLDVQGVIGLPNQADFSLRLGGVHLKVRELDRSIAFYAHYLGLELVERTGKTYAFLSNSSAHHVIALQNVGANAPLPAYEASGLYSVSFEVPDQFAFARLYQRLTEAGIQVSLTDHLISWGMYFQDPDGNGIEIYWDTRNLPGKSHLWQGRDLPLDPEKLKSLLT